MDNIRISFLGSGNTMAFWTDVPSQISELQKSWVEVYCEYIESKGFDPTTIIFVSPNNETIKVFKVEDGYNWKIIRPQT